MKRIKTFLKRKIISSAYSLSRILNIPLIKPDFVQLNLTTRCNLSCRICSFADEGSDIEKELTVTEIGEIAKQSAKWKLNQIVLSGGEPFLRKDIFAILDTITKNGADMVITSNGVLLNDEILEKLNETSLKHLQISIDGACAKTHDYIRGEGAFKKTVENIKKVVVLKKRKYSVGISFTVMPYNYKEMEGLLKLAKDLNVDTVLFIPVISDNSYREIDQEKDFFSFSTDKIQDLRSSFECVEEFKQNQIKPEISNFDNMKSYWKYFEGQKNTWKCYAGYRWLQINPYGETKMCGTTYDNFRNNPDLKKIWHSSSAKKARADIKKCKVLCMQPCMSKPV